MSSRGTDDIKRHHEELSDEVIPNTLALMGIASATLVMTANRHHEELSDEVIPNALALKGLLQLRFAMTSTAPAARNDL